MEKLSFYDVKTKGKFETEDYSVREKDLQKERILSKNLLEEKIMSLLDGESTYDRTHALLLCSSFRFTKGELFLLDR